jgi:taurine dioxygenase
MSTAAGIASSTAAPFGVEPCPAALGAEVTGVDLTSIDEATFDALHAVWLDHLLLVFRKQRFQAEDLVTLVRRFGTPVTSSALHKRGLEERTANKVFNLPPEVTVVTNVRENGRPVGILGDGEVVWHSDFSFKEAPTAARMLLAVDLPPAGGYTYFTNCYAAYDALTDDMKRRIAGKTIKQANIVDTAMQIRPGASLDMDIRDIPGPSHPIISTHPETGRNMIFLGRRHSAYVNGMSLEASEALLEELWAHTVQQRFVYVHRWQAGDIVVWDNRATLHRRDAFDSQSRRVLYAAQVEGHRPFEAPDALSLPRHSRFDPAHA